MSEAQARKLETEIEWNGKANVCIHCGRVPETFYTVTGHDHTDDSIRWCICRERYSQSEKHALLKENAALRAEVERLKVHQCTPVCVFHEGEELRKLCEQLAVSQLEAKRLRDAIFDMAGEEPAHSWKVAKKIEALSPPTSTEALDAYVAEKVKDATKPLVRAIDEHMVVNHQGVFNFGDDPKEALNKIACFEQELGAYFANEQLEELTRQRDLAVSAATKARNQAQQCALVCSKNLDVYRALMNMIDVTGEALAAIKEIEV